RAAVPISDQKLPHPAFWGGDFSPAINPSAANPAKLLPDVPAGVTLTPAEVLTDTYLGLGQKFVTIPSRLLDPNVQQLISIYFPKISPLVPINLANGRIKNLFQTLLPGGSTRDLGTLRVDHDLTDKDHVYGVYNASAFVGATSPVRNPFTGLGLVQNDRRNNTVSGSYVRTIDNNLINEARGGFNREYSFRHSNTTLSGFLSSIGFDSNAIDAYGAVVGQAELTTHGHAVLDFGATSTTFDRSGHRPAPAPHGRTQLGARLLLPGRLEGHPEVDCQSRRPLRASFAICRQERHHAQFRSNFRQQHWAFYYCLG